MKKLIASIFIASFLLTSCEERKPETLIKLDSVEKTTVKKDSTLIIDKEMKTRTGKIFSIIESKPSYSVSNYFISGKDFLNSADTIIYLNKNPMTNALITDLDKNGFEELYIFTKSSDTNSFIGILGVASLNDKAFGEIDVQQITAEDIKKDEKFNGYLGHDSVYISGNEIIREFPVFKSSVPDLNSVNGRRKVIYKLKKDPKDYKLVITGSEIIN